MKYLKVILASIGYRIKYFPRIKTKYLFIEGKFKLGKASSISRGAIVIVSQGAELNIKPQTYIGEYSNIRCSYKIEIGENCKIAQFVTIVDSDYNFKTKPLNFNSINKKEVIIGNDVFIGTGAVILRGVIVNNNSIISPNQVIKRE